MTPPTSASKGILPIVAVAVLGLAVVVGVLLVTREPGAPGAVALQNVPTQPAVNQAVSTLPDFVKHTERATREIGPMMDDLNRHFQLYAKLFDDLWAGAVVEDQANIVAFMNKELAWLDANPPDACYAEVHRQYGAAMTAYRDAFTNTTPNINTGMLQAANLLMGDANFAINEVACP